MNAGKYIWYREFRNNYNLFCTSLRIKSINKFMKKEGISGNMIIDLGAGRGVFNKSFRELKFKKIIAVDRDDKALQKNDAYEKIIEDLEEKLPFRDQLCECVVGTKVMEHLA